MTDHLRIVDRIEDAEPIRPFGNQTNGGRDDQDSKSVAISATPYVWRDPQNIPARDWIYGRSLLRGSLSMFVAPGAAGKTALTVGTAMALITGRDLLGKKVWIGPCRVWLWNLEDSCDELDRLVQAAAMHWSIDAAGM